VVTVPSFSSPLFGCAGSWRRALLAWGRAATGGVVVEGALAVQRGECAVQTAEDLLGKLAYAAVLRRGRGHRRVLEQGLEGGRGLPPPRHQLGRLESCRNIARSKCHGRNTMLSALSERLICALASLFTEGPKQYRDCPIREYIAGEWIGSSAVDCSHQLCLESLRVGVKCSLTIN
jgi:hypothetical protein